MGYILSGAVFAAFAFIGIWWRGGSILPAILPALLALGIGYAFHWWEKRRPEPLSDEEQLRRAKRVTYGILAFGVVFFGYLFAVGDLP